MSLSPDTQLVQNIQRLAWTLGRNTRGQVAAILGTGFSRTDVASWFNRSHRWVSLQRLRFPLVGPSVDTSLVSNYAQNVLRVKVSKEMVAAHLKWLDSELAFRSGDATRDGGTRYCYDTREGLYFDNYRPAFAEILTHLVEANPVMIHHLIDVARSTDCTKRTVRANQC